METLRRELKPGIGFHDHVILIQFRVECVDLALAECVVERVVYGCRRDAETRSSGAVDG